MARVFFDTRVNIDSEAISNTTTYVVKQSDSGKTFMVSGGAQAVTLPPVAELQKGWHCTFVNSASPSGDKTIGAGSAIIHGTMFDGGNDVAASTVGTGVTNVLIEAASQAGDNIKFFTDGALYYFQSTSGTNTAYTTS
tara:strand:+ start:105 stop:518 length:414 start_codon:yes stop_codon:yes gene_type:complete